jgi:hypothetical protein
MHRTGPALYCEREPPSPSLLTSCSALLSSSHQTRCLRQHHRRQPSRLCVRICRHSLRVSARIAAAAALSMSGKHPPPPQRHNKSGSSPFPNSGYGSPMSNLYSPQPSTASSSSSPHSRYSSTSTSSSSSRSPQAPRPLSQPKAKASPRPSDRSALIGRSQSTQRGGAHRRLRRLTDHTGDPDTGEDRINADTEPPPNPPPRRVAVAHHSPPLHDHRSHPLPAIGSRSSSAEETSITSSARPHACDAPGCRMSHLP